MTSTTFAPESATRAGLLGTSSLALGLVAAGVCMVLSFVSLAAGAVALVLGGLALRRGGRSTSSVVGMTAAGVSIYLILLEVLFLGG